MSSPLLCERCRHVGKNLAQLSHSVDSLNQRIDSINYGYGQKLVNNIYYTQVRDEVRNDSAYFADLQVKSGQQAIDLDSIYASLTSEQMKDLTQKAMNRANNVIQTFAIQREMQTYEQKNVNYHAIEMHRKFTLSVACLLFFFIGAPLGAIIRKGGLGVPIITGVLFFIFYYVIDNTGYKAAKDGSMEPWFGIWLSSMVLAPIGIWLTWRAINDAPLFDWDTYKIRFTHAMRWVLRHCRPLLTFLKAHRPKRAARVSAFFGRRHKSDNTTHTL